jgi:hypothetical protein
MNHIYTGRFYLSAIVFNQWRFFLPEFRIAGVPSNIRTFQINAHMLSVYSTTCLVAYAHCDFLNITN